MKRLLLWAVVSALSLSASATITQVQSQPNWACSGPSCAATFTLVPAQHDLVVVWTFWQSTGSFTASAADNLTCTGLPCNTYLSAVGPTLQSSASTPTSTQIFYAKNFRNPLGSSVMVTVTFSGTGTVSLAGMVIVEYMGADTNYPLDSVSAGYSTTLNPTSLLDSGTVAPANSNLLVFAGGTSDTTATVGAGTGFTGIQTHPGSITEQLITTSPNNILQRATACIGAALPCPVTGNWVMQMAVFRDASWTVSGGWTPIRDASTLYADQYPGATPDAQITNALNAAASGQEIQYRCAPGTTLTPFAATLAINKPVNLKLGGCTFLGPGSGYMIEVKSRADRQRRFTASAITPFCIPSQTPISYTSTRGTLSGKSPICWWTMAWPRLPAHTERLSMPTLPHKIRMCWSTI